MEEIMDKIKKFIMACAVIFAKFVSITVIVAVVVSCILVLLSTVFEIAVIEQMSLTGAAAVIIISIIVTILFIIDFERLGSALMLFDVLGFVLFTILATAIINWSLKIFFGLVVDSLLWAIVIMVISMTGALLLVLSFKWDEIIIRTAK